MRRTVYTLKSGLRARDWSLAFMDNAGVMDHTASSLRSRSWLSCVGAGFIARFYGAFTPIFLRLRLFVFEIPEVL